MRVKKKKYLGLYFGILIFFITGCHSENVKENTQSISNVTNEVVFSADFSGNSPSDKQFYSWEGREYDGKLYEPLSAIECEDNTAHLKTFYDDSIGLWRTQMLSTAGIFETDDFTCEFQGKFSDEVGSWQCVITYGTGTYWTDDIYSDGIKWPSGGEIDVFEQTFQIDTETGEKKARFVPSIHYGNGRDSVYPDAHLVERGEAVEFKAGEWHKFKFSLNDGILTAWIDEEKICENNYSEYTVNNDYLCEYHPFLNPQAFYIEAGVDVSKADKSKVYEFCIKDFTIYQEKNVDCTSLEIFPEMWEKGTELVFPVGSVLYLEKNFTPEDTSNKACKWHSSDESVATVTEGFVKTLSEGKTVITAKCGKASAEYIVTVSNSASVPIAKIQPSNNNITIMQGKEFELQYYAYPSFATEEVRAESKNKEIIDIIEDNIKGISIGESEILLTSNSQNAMIDVSVVENTREPFAEYDLTEISSLIGLNESQQGYVTSCSVSNTGTEGETLDLSAEINITDMLVESKWSKGIIGITLETPVLETPKQLKTYPTLYLLKGKRGILRTNSGNVNSMPSIDITDNEIKVRYGDVEFYQASTGGERMHCIGVYIYKGKSYLYIDGKKVVDGAGTTYIQNLQQLILSTDTKGGLESFAAYLDVEFSEEQLIEMTMI